MKAVVMAGGKGTRLAPLTDPLNKHTVRVYDRPMIFHVVEALVRGGVTDVLMLLNHKHPQMLMEMLEDGREFGCRILYSYLRSVDGPGRQLYLAEHWVNGDDFVLMLGDALFTCAFDFKKARAPHMWIMPITPDWDDPSKYGQVAFAPDGHITSLVEKPEVQVSDLIQTAVWKLPADVFDHARKLQSTVPDGTEIHVGDIIPKYVQEGRMTATPIPMGTYIDLGTVDALERGATLIRNLRKAETCT